MRDVAGGEDALEVVDAVVARLPLLLGDEVVDADDEHVLVVRAVEHADLPAARLGLVDAPQEVVGQLLARGRLERR